MNIDSRLPFQKIEDFHLVRVIQDSPYAIAIEAYQTSLQRPVFIKLLKPQVKEHRQWVTRFTREAQVSASLKHPHIVDIYTIGEKEGYTFMAQAWVEGLSLKELLSHEKILPPEIALEITHQILQALRFAHRKNIIHRDIKPGNILIDIYGEAHLTDFGLAHLGEEISLTQPGSILGTPAYMAPEQVTGEGVTPATDLFAMGATLYEMLTGIKPFAGENYSACIQKILNVDPLSPSTHNLKIRKEIDVFVLHLLEKDAKHRPQTASQALENLTTLISTDSHAQIINQISLLIKKYYQSIKVTHSSGNKPKSVVSTDGPAVHKKTSMKWGLLTGSAVAIIGIFLIILIFKFKADSRDQPATIHLENDSVKTLIDKPGSALDNKANLSGKTAKEEIQDQSEDFGSNSQYSSPVKKESPTVNIGKLETQSDAEGGVNKSSTQLASIEILVKPWATLSLDGTVLDSMVNERRLSLPPGNHRLVFSHPEFTPKVFEVDIKPGETKSLDYSFYQDAGYLGIEVRPWAEIFLDGKYLDTTPTNRLVILSQGEHLIELKNPYYDTYRQLLEIKAGDTLYLKHTLAK